MGSHLARMLSGNGHDITVIDQDVKALDELHSLADLITIEGDTTTFAVLRKAGVRRCDLFIAVNHEENTNILSYTDAFDVSEYAIPAMQWACGAGLMGNSADGSLAPTSQAIRAHTAYMLANLLKPA